MEAQGTRDWEEVVARQAHVRRGPTHEWTDGHVLGNGDVGAVVWGGPDRLCVGLSKHDLYDLDADAEHGTRWDMTYPEIARRVLAGEREFLEQIGNRPDVRPEQLVPLSAGILALELLRGQPSAGFEQRLSFLDGECAATAIPTPFGWSWGMRFAPITVTCAVHAERNVVLVRLESDLPQRVAWSFTRHAPERLPQPVYAATGPGDLGCMAHSLPAGESYAVALAAGAGTLHATASAHGILGTIAFGGEAGPALLVLGLATGRDAGAQAPKAMASASVSEALALGGEALWASHRSWWRRFWSRSGVDYEDAEITRLWHMGLYALASSTRPHTSPPHLQGIWNQYDVPPWHSDFHFNVNLQESLWAACTSNHPELQAAFVRCLTHDWREEFRRFAREQFEAPGLAIPFNTDWLGRSISGWPLAGELCPTAWAAQHVWWQWLYTGDVQLLRQEVYPFLRECCEFTTHLLVRNADGRYHIPVSQSPEQCWPDREGRIRIVFGSDPAIDLAFLRDLFGNMVAAAHALEADDPFIERCAHIAEHLAPLPTRDGVLIDYETGFFQDGDRPGFFPWCHRHPSRLAAIFPCDAIGLQGDAETLEMGRRSFREFRGYGEEDVTGWSLTFQACLAARLGLGGDAEACLRTLCERYLLGGLLTSHNDLAGDRGPLFQIEALLGMPAALNEMLLQSGGGVIRLFPALPSGRRAAFHHLRVPGGWLVSAEHDGERVIRAAFECTVSGPIAVRNPFPEGIARLDGPLGTSVLQGTVLRWQGREGAIYHVLS